MRRQIGIAALFSGGLTLPVCMLAALGGFGRPSLADDEFQDLVNQIPRSANAVVLLNMEKAKDSALGLKEDWNAKVEEAFQSGLVARAAPGDAFRPGVADRLRVHGASLEAAVIELNEDLSSTQIEKMRHGTLDTIEGLPAIVRPNDTYIVKLAPKTVIAMAPANRQAVVRWIREIRKPSPPPLSAYLQKAAVYSDKAGSDIIMAIDLDGVFSFKRIGKYLKSKQKRPGQVGSRSAATDEAARHRAGDSHRRPHREQPSGMIVIDMRGDASDCRILCQAAVVADHGGSGRGNQRPAILDGQGPRTRNLAGRQALQERLAAADERGRFACRREFDR